MAARQTHTLNCMHALPPLPADTRTPRGPSRALLPLALGFAAGCMIWIVLAELLPDALEAVDAERVATCATGSAAW